MASNIREFSLSVGKIGSDLPAERVGALHRAVALQALRGVVLMMPVDSGRARGAVTVSIGEPDLTEPGTLDKSGGPTIARGAAIIATIKAFSMSWIVLAVPYAQELENGHSQQAPRGMFGVTFTRLQNWLRRQR